MGDDSSTIQVSGLARDKLGALRAQAKAAGMTVAAYARRLLEEGISPEQEARATTFDALYAPVRRRFQASRMSQADLDDLVTAVRRHHRRASRKKA
jgi:hypothetical protein